MKLTIVATTNLIMVALVAVASVIVFAPVAAAKDFKPGDLRICTGRSCVSIENQRVLDVIGAFFYERLTPRPVGTPKPGSLSVELRFRNGYVTGVAAGTGFDRFLSFGVDLGQFAPRTWYAIPVRAAAEIRRLAKSVRPTAMQSLIG